MNYNKLKTEEIYELLPSIIQYKDNEYIGEYFLYLHKGQNGTIIEYVNNNEEALGDTYRKHYELRDVLVLMHKFLVKFNYMSKLQYVEKKLKNGE